MFLDELSRILRLKVSADQKIELAQRETEKIINYSYINYL
ncbi:hypothetical protein LCGC14_2094190 [marine sediment metagenome]|uniref:Uncharacterized protein n=1 Tax=marine sediment metagenome TaxID=412755 RepID=A0A0F9EZ66_9ZZZZ